MIFSVSTGSGSTDMSLYILVKADPNTQVTATKGTNVISDTTDENGEVKLYPTETGEWTVSNGEDSMVVDVQYPDIEANFIAKVFGIQKDITDSSPQWERTDDSVGLSAMASVGTIENVSDFSQFAPYKDIVREEISGNMMVKIPRFYFKRWQDGNIEHIQISSEYFDGATIHPAFLHNDSQQEYIYVGAYETSNYKQSVTGQLPTVQSDIENFRNQAKSLGTGWGLYDGTTRDALLMLYLVEFATFDSQTAIGNGIVYAAGRSATGGSDNVPGPNGKSNSSGDCWVKYRYIENLWGNVFEWVDGVVRKLNAEIWVNNDQSQYNNAGDNYVKLSYQLPTAIGFITRNGFDENNPSYMLPSAIQGSSSTYLCDQLWNSGSSGTTPLSTGGAYNQNVNAGLFAANTLQWQAGNEFGSRLLYIPQ